MILVGTDHKSYGSCDSRKLNRASIDEIDDRPNKIGDLYV